MKRASKISLITAAVIIALGLIVCVVASNMAKKNGEELFPGFKDGDKIDTVDLEDSDISKIEIIADRAKINIYGGCDKSYVEFINFNELFYTMSLANRVLSFTEISDMVSAAKFWENGFSFKGMRYFLDFDFSRETSRGKIINIYLADTKEIKIFDIKVKNCNLTISDISSPADYYITSKTLEITANNVTTSSVISIAGEDKAPLDTAKVFMNDVSARSLKVDAKNLELTCLLATVSSSSEIACDDGSVSISLADAADTYSFDILSEYGGVSFNSKSANPYKTTGGAENAPAVKITTKSADITVITAQPAANSDAG